MAEATNELIVQVLQRIQGDLADLKIDTCEIRQRIGSLEVQMFGMPMRMDRRDEPMERIMRRLDLIDDIHALSL